MVIFISERQVEIINYFRMPRLPRVAAYCRVSTQNDEQKKSLAAQIDYYVKMARKHYNWDFIGVYADAISGKSSSRRPELQRLLDDCKDKKVDRIITKSISRLGRNTAEILDMINKLSRLEVDIYFETENLHTLEKDKTTLITVIEAYAQAESEVRSKNIKWGIQRGLENGTSKLYNRKCYGYNNNEEGNLVIVPEEANNVKLIYELYLKGYSILGIIKELKNQCINSPTGKYNWNKRTVEMILCNEKYTGNVLIGKTYGYEYPLIGRFFNKGERPKYMISDMHPAIISQEQFNAVQLERERRINVVADGNIIKRKSTHYSMKSCSDDNNDSSL